ncbi:hypothetical protein Tco_0455833 [Tanacetum coccineum]
MITILRFVYCDGMSADVARGHDGDGGGDDRPPPYQVRTRKPIWWTEEQARCHTRQRPGSLSKSGSSRIRVAPVPNRIKVNDRETLMPLGDHAAHWANYLEELVRELPLHYPSWCQMLPEWKARVVAKIGVNENPQLTRESPVADPHFLLDTYCSRLNTPTGVPYIEDEIMALVPLGHSSWGHILGVDGFAREQARSYLPILKARTLSISLAQKEEKRLHETSEHIS